MSALSLDNTEIVNAILLVMGVGRTAANMDTSTESDVRAILRAGLRKFYYPVFAGGSIHQWSFLSRHFQISAVDKYDTGTIAISGGTVTLTGGTFPTDMVDYFIEVGSHVVFVTTRTDDTHVEVSHSQLSIAAGTSYEAYQFRYALPSDFSEFQNGLVYQDGSNYYWPLSGANEAELRLRYATSQGVSNRTTHYAVTNATSDGTKRVMLWPVPVTNAFIQGKYMAAPDDNLVSDLTTPGSTVQVPSIYSDAVLECILSSAEEYNADTQGVHTARAQSALQTAIMHDRATGAQFDFSFRTGDDVYFPEASSINFSGALI